LNNTSKNIIIAGGGTGGHIFPAVAIANAWKNRHAQADILFVGALGKMEMEKVPKEGYKIIGLPIAGFNRSNMLKNLSLPFKMVKSYFLAKKILKQNKPSAVVGVGGFASLPMLYVAQSMGIPTLIQEQNGFAGKANKALAKKAKAICVAYDGMEQFFSADKITFTGNPVRKSIAQSNIDKQSALEKFGLNANKKTLLIIGGSLGAKSINDVLIAQYQILLDADLQILWQTGKPSFAAASASVQGKENIFVHEFIYDMQFAYAAADFVISRSGALSIAELCICGKPVVFVPYPFAAEDHQTTNAMKLVNKQAALCINDANVQSELVPKIIALANNRTQCDELSANIKALAITDADERIINQLDKIVGTA
jgi:UDP-N-acetylglucosamine--N-acetylmuramyl-(pentapeptide) pyrophosphoryl-undecaprenol N-acetylglucosamine transferase